MQKIVENGVFTFEINVERRQNGVSSVACIKSFVKPESSSKVNKVVVDGIENRVIEITGLFVEKSDLLSDNHLVDFDCTRDNLNPEKWSRLKVDLYLFTPFIKCSDELMEETMALCEKLGNGIRRRLEEGRFLMSRTVV